MTERMLKHRSLAIEAPESIWRALKFQVYSNVDIVGDQYFDNNGSMDVLLAIATVNGLSGSQALSWAATEHQRQREQSAMAASVRANATAIENLAKALSDQSDQNVVQKVMGKLSEATQWSLRKQLAGTGLLP